MPSLVHGPASWRRALPLPPTMAVVTAAGNARPAMKWLSRHVDPPQIGRAPAPRWAATQTPEIAPAGDDRARCWDLPPLDFTRER